MCLFGRGARDGATWRRRWYPGQGWLRLDPEVFNLNLDPYTFRLFVHVIGRASATSDGLFFEATGNTARFLGWNRRTVERHLGKLKSRPPRERLITEVGRVRRPQGGEASRVYKVAFVDSTLPRSSSRFSRIPFSWLQDRRLSIRPARFRLLAELVNRSRSCLVQKTKRGLVLLDSKHYKPVWAITPKNEHRYAQDFRPPPPEGWRRYFLTAQTISVSALAKVIKVDRSVVRRELAWLEESSAVYKECVFTGGREETRYGFIDIDLERAGRDFYWSKQAWHDEDE